MAGKQGFLAYVKAIFWNPVHLATLVGAASLSVFFGWRHLDVLLPLIGAGEVTFLTVLASNPRFQRLIDSEAGVDTPAASSPEELNRRLTVVLRGLDQKSREQFEQLRMRCEPLRIMNSHQVEGEPTADLQTYSAEQMGNVNKLLWVYLKLLYTRCTLQRFFKSVNEDEIVKLQSDTKKRLEALPPASGDDLTEKKRRSLDDMLKTATARVENLKRAKDNYEYVELELERIGTTLAAVAEKAINRQDPGKITTEVDDVARSVDSTEQTINDLHMFTGLSAEEAAAPALLQPIRPPQSQVRA